MLDFYPTQIYYPLEEAEKKYQSGALKQIELHLLDFVDRHLEEITDIAYDDNCSATDEDIINAIKSEILARGSIQPAAELADVIKEINKEIWYNGEKEQRSQDFKEIAALWQIEYAAKWQEARMFETFVVLKHCEEQILAKFSGVR